MRPITVTTTDASGGATYSNIITVDTYREYLNIGIGMTVTGTVSAKLQYTYDDPNGASPLWRDDATFTGKTANFDMNWTKPVRGLRIAQASGSGSTSTVFISCGGPDRG